MIKQFTKSFIQKNKFIFAIYGLATIGSALSPIALSSLSSSIMNTVKIRKVDFILFVLLLFIIAFSTYYQNKLSITLTNRYQNDLVFSTYDTIIQKKYNFIRNQNTNATFAQKLIQEIRNIANYYCITIMNYYKGIIGVLVTLFILFNQNHTITVIFCICLIVYTFMTHYTNEFIYKHQKEVIHLQSELFGKTQESLDNIEQIKYYNLYQHSKDTIFESGLKYIYAFLKKLDIQIFQSSMLSIMKYLFICGYILSSLKASKIGDVILVIGLVEPFFDSFKLLVSFYQTKHSIKASKETIESNLENTAEKKPIITKTPANNISYLQLINLQGDKQKCHPINYTFKTGNIYCITGENGIGKTTLFNILLGLDKNYKGKIYYNEVPINDIDFEKMYANSLFYMDQASELLEYIDTGNKTVDFSRGERQQILLNEINDDKKGRLILLDEPTASLDIDQKNRIINKLNKLKKDNIILIITHDEHLLSHGFDRLELKPNV